MREEEPDWGQVQRDVQVLLERNRGILPSDEYEHIQQLNAHDEYEMALEKLCLSLMSRSAISADDYPEFVRLGKLLKLDEETVYEWDFWQLLMLEGHGGVE